MGYTTTVVAAAMAAVGRVNRTALWAAMAAALTVASLPVEATRNGLSPKQVRAIVKQEVTKAVKGLRGPNGDRGPAGPPEPQGVAGPAGMDGLPPLFAEITTIGTVNPYGPSNGITDENVVMLDIPQTETEPGDIVYCFSGLPPLSWGQVTVSDTEENRENGPVSGYLALDTGEPECSPRVRMVTPSGHPVAAGFHILVD